jgi:hypothetical protein
MRGAEAGQVGGIEGLAFGVLVFVFGALVVGNAWAVVDAKAAATAAAREAARAYVESAGDAAAVEAGLLAFEGHGRSRDRATVGRAAGRPARCERVVFEATYVVPLVSVPVIGGAGRGFRVSARHSEVVDPYRSGLGAEAADCGR